MMIGGTPKRPGVALFVVIFVLTLQAAVVFVAAAAAEYTFNDSAILEPDGDIKRATQDSSEIDVARLRIPSIQVDAAVEVAGLDKHGAMENPSDPWDVAWYDFSPLPGNQGNAVFSGHVDHADVGPAVFWDLRRLPPNAVVEVSLADGTVLKYRVIAKTSVDVDAAPIEAIVGPTENEMITLITCAGTYSEQGDGYNQRLIVRAQRTGG